MWLTTMQLGAISFRVVSEFEVLTLPFWYMADGPKGYYPGGGLFPEACLPKGGADYIAKMEKEKLPKVPKVNMLDLEPQGLDVLPSRLVLDLPEIEGELADYYIGQKPVEHLIDPQQLIDPKVANHILRFLENHSASADIDIFVFVLGGLQELPADVDMVQLHQEWFTDRPAVTMIYRFDQLSNTELIYNTDFANRLPTEVFMEIGQACMAEVEGVYDVADQLEKFTLELGIQTFRLQSLYEKAPILEEVQPIAPESLIADVEPTIQDDLELANVESMPALVESVDEELTLATASLHEKLLHLREQKLGRWIAITSCLLLIVSIALAIRLLTCRDPFSRRREATLENVPETVFPEFESQPRLGGQRSGGRFVGVSFDLDNPQVRIS